MHINNHKLQYEETIKNNIEQKTKNKLEQNVVSLWVSGLVVFQQIQLLEVYLLIKVIGVFIASARSLLHLRKVSNAP